MADKEVTKKVLQLVANFADEDTRTFTVDNPQATITAAQVNDLSSYIAANDVLIGDKNGADFTRISSAKIIEGTTLYFDLTD